MDSRKNLVQMFTFDPGDGSYQFVWNTPREVEAIDDIYVQYEMYASRQRSPRASSCAPRQTTCSSWRGTCSRSRLPTTRAIREAAHFRSGKFRIAVSHMIMKGTRNFFVAKAVSGNFAKTNVGTEQLIVQCGNVDVVNYTINYDVSWVLEKNGTLTTQETNPNFIERKQTDDNGTFLTLAACNINQNNAFKFALKSKSFGWSAPQPLAILASVPYWSELSDERLGDEKTSIGTTSFGISSSESAGTEGRWSLGGGFNVSAELLLDVGFGGNKGMLGGGFDFGAMFNYAGSYYRERNVEHSLTYEEYAGRTMVVTSAVPVVVYEYDVYVPEFTITQEYLDEYNKHVDPSKRWGKEKVGTQAGNTHVTCKIDNTYDATLGLITLDDYNKAAANVGSADVPTIDMDNVLQHTQGDPTTYPTQTSQIANVRNNAILSTTNAVPVTADRGTETSASITVTDTTQVHQRI